MKVVARVDYIFTEAGTDFTGCGGCTVPAVYCEDEKFQSLCKAGTVGNFAECVSCLHREGSAAEFDRLVV
jgi:hypothetical protein